MGTYAATNENIIENIYLGGGKFDKGNLNKLAAKVGYTSGVSDLVTAATDFNYTTDNIGFKNSADFGDTVVKFGSYTYGGVERELSWYPTFVSKSDGGDVILTLWLAETEKDNGTVSDQEVSMFSGSGYNSSTETKLSSNNYSSSKIRALINNGGTYYSNYDDTFGVQNVGTGDNDIHEETYPTTNDNKFSLFITGSVQDYIVTPSVVSWQNSANRLKNDPNWNGNSGGHYTPNGWLEDKLWIPSMYEVYDYSVAENSTIYRFTENGGIWRTGDMNNKAKRSNSRWTWVRSGHATAVNAVFYISDTIGYDAYKADFEGAVRPALHLNLTKAAANSFNTIENIYDQTDGKFSAANLSAIAQKVGYSDIKDMVAKVKAAATTDAAPAVKTSENFGNTAVKFGTYTFGGVTRELTWLPTFVSKDKDGNAILTLWLAGTDSANGLVSNQEISTYSDGTWHNSMTQDFHGKMVYSNSYYGSYIRGYVINGNNDYTTWITNTPITPPEAETMTKFTQFTTGDLSSFIVEPSKLDWQMKEAYQKNDPAFESVVVGESTIFGENYPNDWTGDKLWLPGVYEVYDSTLQPNSDATSFTENGGLWQTNAAIRSNTETAWLRSARVTVLRGTLAMGADGSALKGPDYVGSSYCAVRPALHLNLSKALCNSSGHTWDEGTVTKEATCAETGTKFFTCTTCGETKTETIEKLDHNWDTTVWQSDDTNHWHKCANCTEITDNAEHTASEWITDTPATCTQEGTQHKECTTCKKILETGTIPLVEHSWNEGTQTAAPTCTQEGVKTYTCTVCGETKTETIEKLAHTPETISAVAPTCTETGLTEGSKCSVCNTIIKAQEIVPKLDHTLGTWQHDDTNHWKLCSVCNTKQENAAHNFGAWTITKPATKDEQGEKRCECTVCGLTKTEVIAKLVEDEGGNGSVGDLPELPDPDSNYKLEITIKATDKVYALDGQSKGYNVRLWIVNNKNDEDKQELYKEEVTLSLIVPHGMEDFTLYRLVEGGFEEIKPENYTVEAGVLSIRTTLPEEFIFNTAAEEPVKAGVPWWVWLMVGLAVVAVVIIIVIVVVKKKHTHAPETETVYVNGESYDDTELKRKVEEQNEKIDELLNREIPVDALSQTLTDDEMRSFFTDQELNDMVKQGKITQEDCDRVIRGRKK